MAKRFAPFKPDDDFPELSKHNNVMAKVLTKPVSNIMENGLT